MRRTISTVIVLALVLALGLAVAACGSSDSGAANSTPAPSSTLSAEQLVQQSMAATGKVESGSFTADLALAVQGDTSKMDATTRAMIGQGLSFHAAGKSAKSPLAMDMTMSVGVAGQKLEFSLMAQGDKAWIGYQGTWYVIDQKTAKSLGGRAATGSSTTNQLKSLGIDPADWGATYELVGTEDVGGVPTFHVKATADPQKLAASLLKAMEDPAVTKQLGENTTGKQLRSSLMKNQKELKQLQKSLRNTTADFWIGADDMLMRKVTMSVKLDMTGQTSNNVKGVDTVTLSGALALADFGETVTVTPPANALPFSQLMSSLFGGMFGGASGSPML
jgi:hypothetical protein